MLEAFCQLLDSSVDSEEEEQEVIEFEDCESACEFDSKQIESPSRIYTQIRCVGCHLLRDCLSPIPGTRLRSLTSEH